MAWVKKRRAEREKAKLAAGKEDQEDEDTNPEKPQPTIAEEKEEEAPRLPKEGISHPSIDVPTATPIEQPHERPEHITAINLPPQSRSHKREPSVGHRIPIPQVEKPTKEKPSFGVDVFDMDLDQGTSVKPETEANTSSASEDEDVEDEDSPSSDGDDEDDSDTFFEVYTPSLSSIRSTNLESSRRRTRTVRRLWALVSRKSAGIRIHLSRRHPICPIPPSKTSYPAPL